MPTTSSTARRKTSCSSKSATAAPAIRSSIRTTTWPRSTRTAGSNTPARTARRSSALAGPGDDLLLLLAQAADAERHDIARLEEHGLRLDAQAHAGRRASADHVAREQRHVLADMGNDLRAA